MRFAIGIDIGFANTGIAVENIPTKELVFSTVVTTCPSKKKLGIRIADDNIQRCMDTTKAIVNVIRDYPACILFVELPHGGAKSASSMRAMGLASGVIAAVAEIMNVPTDWLTPSNIKEGTTGSKHANKDAVQRAVAGQYPKWNWLKTGKVEHEADAAACIIVGRSSNIYRMAERDRQEIWEPPTT